MRPKYKVTGCARFFVFLVLFVPAVFFGAAYFRGENGVQIIKDFYHSIVGGSSVDEGAKEKAKEKAKAEEKAEEEAKDKDEAKAEEEAKDKEIERLKQEIEEKDKEIEKLKSGEK